MTLFTWVYFPATPFVAFFFFDVRSIIQFTVGGSGNNNSTNTQTGGNNGQNGNNTQTGGNNGKNGGNNGQNGGNNGQKPGKGRNGRRYERRFFGWQ